MKKKIYFNENGNEYNGSLEIVCKEFKILNERTFMVNGAIIRIDEAINDEKTLKDNDLKELDALCVTDDQEEGK